MAEALYRKYRPQIFADMVGQDPIARTLRNAIEQDKVSHAYLFCGPRGTGKTTTARLLAKALLCQQGPTPDPDGECEDCRLIAEGIHPDVYELDAASRTGVDNVREEIINRVQFAPTRGAYKIYIIDEVHMLSTAAFNALLKTLEEPPGHIVFILCTTDPQKVPETIHSRCQRFDFRRIAPESMVSRLGAVCVAEGVQFEGEALDLIAHRAEGGMRNALTSLEQIIAFENGKVTLAGAERLLGSIDSNDMAEIMSCIGKRDVAGCFRFTANYVETGADLAQFVRDMAEHVRNLYVMSLVGQDVELDVSDTARRQLSRELAWFGPDRASRLLGVLGDLSAELKTSSNARLSFEIALTRMVRPDSDITLSSIVERLEALEAGYSSVAHVLPDDAPARGAGYAEEPRVSADPAQAVRQVETVDVARRVAEPAPAPRREEPAAAPEMRREAVVASEAPSMPPAGVEGRQEPSVVPEQVVQASSTATGRTEQAPVQEEVRAAQDASVAQAAPQASSARSLSNPAALQRIWQAALAVLKKQKAAYAVLFMNTKVSYDEQSSTVRIAFAPENSFAYNAVQKGEVRDALADAFAKAAGYELGFEYEKMGAREATPEPAAKTASTSVAREAVGAAPAQAAAPAASAAPAAVEPARVATPEPTSAAAAVSSVPADGVRAEAQETPATGAGYYDDDPYYYEEVPYEEYGYDAYFDDGGQRASASVAPDVIARPTSEGPNVQKAQSAGAGSVQQVQADADAQASPDDLQALLRTGFGDGVVFEEVD